MRHLGLRSFAVAALVTTACSSPSGTPGDGAPPIIATLPRALSAGEQALVRANNTFAPSLLAAVTRAEPQGNVLLSPLSASMALGMTMNGASNATFDEMRQALGFGTMGRDEIVRSSRDLIALLRGVDSKVDFRIANAIWYRQEFGPAVEPTFLTESRDYFGARAAALDFNSPASVSTINDWVKTATNGKIDRMVESIDDEIVMLLLNAIYFKGDWREGFDPAQTRNAPFAALGGRTVQVPMMSRSGPARVGRLDGRVMVDLGYGGDAFSMTVVLPNEWENVNTMVVGLTAAQWSAGVASLGQGDVDLTMPRFKIEWERTLNAELKALGMTTAFVPNLADFSRLSSTRGRDLYISYVKQKTFVDVNEVGTEAAASTSVGVGVTSVPVRTVIRVDRPFVFAIRERLSGTILFMGKIVEPPAA